MTLSVEPPRAVSADQSAPLRVRGVDHLVFNTDDMAATIVFYTEVLGMRLVHVTRTRPIVSPENLTAGEPRIGGLAHYFFDMGNDSLLAFFEFPKGTPRSDRDHLGGMQHCAFHVSRAQLDLMMERLREHAVQFVGPLDRRIRHSIYLYDNNGIRLEFTTHPTEEDFETVDSLRQTRAEAEKELARVIPDPARLSRVLDAMPLRMDPA
jgi:catechol 2,3-dioxygenase-like lactoylglutathione lyase family enzyme